MARNKAQANKVSPINSLEIEWWDIERPKDFGELKALDFDLAATGFNLREIDSLTLKADPREDEVPPVPDEPVAKPGDLWVMGVHRLLCGDSTKAEDVSRLMDGSLADCVFTDPPYGVGYDGGTTAREKLVGDENTDLYDPCCKMAFLFSKPKAPLYLWHAGGKGIVAAAAAVAAGYQIRCELVWNKNLAQFGSLSAQYKQKHEPCYYCFKRGHAPTWYGPTNEVTVWDADRSRVNDLHSTQKPVQIVERALRNSSDEADVVLDLFGGSGSTMAACEQNRRVSFTIEIAPGYCDVIVKRWENLTGKKAELCPR